MATSQLPLFEGEASNLININLTDGVYDAFISALIINNLPLSEYAIKSHTSLDPVTPSEYIEQRLVFDLQLRGLLPQLKRK
jgi:hypothetical protein